MTFFLSTGSGPLEESVDFIELHRDSKLIFTYSY